MSALPDIDRLRDDLLRFMAYELPESTGEPIWHGASPFAEIPKLEMELRGEEAPALDDANITRALEAMRARKDCTDFSLAGLIRMLYRYPNSRLLSPTLRADIVDAVLGHIYWVDEPGEEHACFSSENHQILFHSAELLAGQMFPDEIFRNNGHTGRWHIEHAEHLIRHWMDRRITFSFKEWNSNCYYDEDLAALANLYDYAESEDIRENAGQLISLLLLHLALNSFKGIIGSTQGRAYNQQLMHPANQTVTAVTRMYWGQGDHAWSMAAVNLATSRYRIPGVIQAIALDQSPEMENRERHGLHVEDADKFGLKVDTPENLYFFGGAHRLITDMAYALVPEKHGNMRWGVEYAYQFYHDCDRTGQAYDPDPTPTVLRQADVYTFRTPDYMLSCAQDYRKGKPGYQQHIWQATLGGEALVYTTNPSPDDRPNLWAGNGIMPKAVAHRNVLICIYRLIPHLQYGMQPLRHFLYTHAYFPREAFDEVVEVGAWTCGRKGDGYVALRSLLPAYWNGSHEIIADGNRNAWVCELGNQRSHGSFTAFVEGITSSALSGDDSHLSYHSPSQGMIETGWEAPLRVNGEAIAIHDYPRFDNPFCRAAFAEPRFDVHYGEETLTFTFTLQEAERAIAK